MQLINIAITLLAALAFAPSASAKYHTSCACYNGDSYNSRITTLACEYYAKQDDGNPNNVSYDTAQGRCNVAADGSGKLDGDRWEAACQSIAKTGFACADGLGRCYALQKAVQGNC